LKPVDGIGGSALKNIHEEYGSKKERMSAMHKQQKLAQAQQSLPMKNLSGQQKIPYCTALHIICIKRLPGKRSHST